jgi:DNA-binding phage protein
VIAIPDIDPLALPSVALENANRLPLESGIYFALDGQNTVQYIGQSQNLRRRWAGHAQKQHLKKMTGVRIAYLPVQPSLLAGIESVLIEKHCPPLNCLDPQARQMAGVKAYRAKLKDATPPSGFQMRVIQTKQWRVQNLPLALAESQKASSKDVSQLCREAGIGEDTWYRLIAGGSSTIPLATLSRICNALGISLESLGLNPD